jgi:YidC/Oxa1 family membrane protein insertase
MGSTARVILTVAICAAILLVWQYFFTPKTPPPRPMAGTAMEGTSRGTGADRPASQPAEREATSQPATRPSSRPASRPAGAGPRAKDLEGVHTVLRTKGATGTFTTRGASLRRWLLGDPRFQELRKNRLLPVDLVQTEETRGPWPLQTTFPQSDFTVPTDAEFNVVRHSEREILYQWQSRLVRVNKHYVLDPVRSVIWMTLEVTNLARKALRARLEVSLFSHQTGQSDASFTNPYPPVKTVLCYVNGKLHRRSADAIAGKGSGCSATLGCGMEQGAVSQTGEVLWVGSDDRYFLTALVPRDTIAERRCELKLLEKNNIAQGSLLYPERTIEAGKSITHAFTVFVGPKDLKIMDTVKGGADRETHLGEAIEFGWFAILCRPMLWLMKIFYSWFGNWGLAIILLTIVVKLITLYWTQKSMRSMKEMQRLKPKIDALRTKFKDDKDRLNQEMMALYKLHKVNPLGGCLPMLIQMPIWFALYRTLGNAVELYHSRFVGWITDLTAPDPYYVLPIAMGISMYAQQAITPQPVEGTQAKVMKYFMPGMFTVMMLALPSGLTLYIFVNTVLTMIHQWYMNKQDPPPDKAPEKAPDRPSTRRDEGGKRRRRGQKP